MCVFVYTGVYSFGLFTTTIFANAGQVVTGNQTPHFLSACKPNYTALGCTSPLQYITEHKACTGNPYLVASARKSFPSKDAALSFYSAIYTVVGTSVGLWVKGKCLSVEYQPLSLALLECPLPIYFGNCWRNLNRGFVSGVQVLLNG